MMREDAPRRERRGDYAGACGRVGPSRLYASAADDEAADAAGNGALDDLRLVAADEYGVRVRERGVGEVLRQGDVQLAAHVAGRAVQLVDQRPLQHAQKVEERGRYPRGSG